MKNKTYSGITIVLSVIALVAVLSAAFVAFKYVINTPDSPEIKQVNMEYVTQAANLSNWGFACKGNDNVYYSDHNTGIYIDSINGPQLFTDGRYSDLIDFNGKLYCVEYTIEQTDEYSSYEKSQLVSIDYFSKDKSVIYTPPAIDDILALSNIANNNLYFTVSEDALFSVDTNNTVTDTGLRDVMKVTERGIYARKFSSSGLQLLSFDKNVIKGFDSLDPYEVYVLFEVDNYLYIKCSSDGWTTSNYAKMNIDNGEYSVLESHHTYGDVVGVNIKDDLLYLLYRQGNNFTLCSTTLDGNNSTVIKNFETEGSIFHLISIVENKIYFVSPYSETEMFICEINASPVGNQANDQVFTVIEIDNFSGDYNNPISDENNNVEIEVPVETQPERPQVVVPPVPEITTINGNSFSGKISSEDQVDKYKLTATTSGKYNFSFDLSDANTYMRFNIYDEKNKNLESYKFSDGKNVSVTLEAYKTYEIHISQQTNFAQYTISIGIPTPTQTISLNMFSGSINYVDETETYTYTATATGMHNFAFTLSDVNTRGKFSIYNHKNACLESVDFSDGKSVSVDLESGQTYTIYISYKYGYANYSVNISIPNAVRTLSGNVMSGNLSYPKQVDTYLYVAPISGKYNFSFDLDSYASVSVYDAKNASVLSGKFTDDDKTAELIQGNTYEINIRYGNYPTDYNITIGVPHPTQTVSNNALSGSFEFDDQVNKYMYTATRSGIHGLNFKCEGRYKCYFIDENDEYILAETYYTDKTDTVDLIAGKTYTIQFTQYGATGYALEIIPPVPVQTVGLGTVSGEITFEGQHDEYYFTPSNSGEYTFTFSCSDDNPRPKFSIMYNDDYVMYETVSDGKSKTVSLDGGVTYTLTMVQNMFLGAYSFTIN